MLGLSRERLPMSRRFRAQLEDTPLKSTTDVDGWRSPAASMSGEDVAAGTRAAPRSTLERKMKTQGEIEAAVSVGMSDFMLSFIGRGPKSIHAHLVTDMVLVRVEGVLTVAEQRLFETVVPGKGRELFKGLRSHLVESCREMLDQMIQASCGCPCISMHHDISTTTGEEVFVFRLAKVPEMRLKKHS
jgi:uncharacterized protein YbcI